MKVKVTQFVKERNEALFSLDRKKILDFFYKYHDDKLTHDLEKANDEVFWGAVYKAITGITNAPEELKEKAHAWLKSHNWSALDD